MRTPRLLQPLAATCLLCWTLTVAAVETPMTVAFDLPSTDVAVAGVGGIGERGPPGLGGAGVIALSGVSGSVRKAWLYWHGIDLERAALGFIGGNFDYDEAAIEFDGASITGTRIAGTGSNNCWGNDTNPNVETAALYRADVTARVQARGNGDYVFSGLADGAGHSANGMSLIVYFDDGNPDNDVRVRHFEGLKSDWNTTFKVFYQGGPVEAILHVGDGQGEFQGTATRWAALPGPGNLSNELIFGTNRNGQRLWAGLSVPRMLRPRPPSGTGLWDIQRIPFSSLFGQMRDHDVTLRGGNGSAMQGDCYSLMVMQVLEPVTRKPLAMAPALHSFGVVEAQTISPPQVFTVTNWMDFAIRFPLQPQPLGEDAVFPISANTCTGQTLQPGAQCSFSVSCSAGSFGAGTKQDIPLLLTWQAVLPQSLNGRVFSKLYCSFYRAPTRPTLQIEPPQFEFAVTAANQYSAPQTFVVTNSGNVPLTLRGLLGFDRGFELVGTTCNTDMVLAAGAQCQIQARFLAQGSPGSTRATNLFVTFHHPNLGVDRRASQLYAITAPVDAGAVFADGFE